MQLSLSSCITRANANRNQQFARQIAFATILRMRAIQRAFQRLDGLDCCARAPAPARGMDYRGFPAPWA
jgi:hypothetical protein